MKRTAQILLLLSCIVPITLCTAAEQEHSGYVPVGQPTIFWRNGEWQTYRDGKWVPYFEWLRQEEAARQPVVMPEPEPVPVPEDLPVEQASDMGFPVYGGGYGYWFWDPFLQRQRFKQFRDHRRNQHTKDTPAQGRTIVPTAGIGQTTIGIGQQNRRIGQPTIGIGQQSPSIGQPTIGIGKPTIGIGQPAGAIGRPLFSPAPSPPTVLQHQSGIERTGFGMTGRR
jgi:hypothetical protein